MVSLKNNVNNIKADTETIVKDYLKLFSIKLSEKMALILGIISSVFILSLLLLMIIVFISFTLAAYLNTLLVSEYLGYLIVSGFFVLVILLIVFVMLKTKTPMLSNFLVRFIISILDIETKQKPSIKGLKIETEYIKHDIEVSNVKIKADFEMLKYVVMETVFKEVFGMFSSKNRAADKQASDESEPTEG